MIFIERWKEVFYNGWLKYHKRFGILERKDKWELVIHPTRHILPIMYKRVLGKMILMRNIFQASKEDFGKMG